tara:strand:- start:78 stop:293 length:216 start_codon:yes stop_codon:yes gene_type:complete
LAPILILSLGNNNRLVHIAPFGTFDKTMGFRFDGIDHSFRRTMHRATIRGDRLAYLARILQGLSFPQVLLD